MAIGFWRGRTCDLVTGFGGLLICLVSGVLSAAVGSKETSVQRNVASQGSGVTKVVDAVGRPIAGVTVLIQPRPETLFPENLTETTATVTDKDGNFHPPAKEAGDTYFVLRKAGLESLAVEANRSFPEKITMRAARTVSGQVLDSNGQPLANAMIGPVDHPPTMRCLDHWEHRNPMPRQLMRSDSEGRFKLQALPVEAVAVQVSAPGYTPRQVVIVPGETNIKVGLSTGGAIVSGTVLGSKDRAPQASIPIEAKSNTLTLYSFTDSQGTYAFDNMPTGTWYLRAAGGGPLSGTQSRMETFEIESMDEVRNVPLVLNQGILLAGRAVDAETSAGLGSINITLAGYAGRGAKAVLTDPDGTFAFENLDSLQDVLLRFDPVKYVYIPQVGTYRDYFDINQAGDTNFDLTTLTVPLHRRLEVKGTVRDADGKPVPDVEIFLQSKDVRNSRPSKSGPGALQYSAYSNAQGQFQTGVYPPGEYKAWAQQEALVSQVQQISAFTTSPVSPLDLRLTQAAQISGMVTDANDKPVTNAVVIAWPAEGIEPEEEPIPGRESYRYTKTDLHGQFEMKGLRGEDAILRATHKDYVQSVKMPFNPSTLTGGTSTGLVLKFPAGGELTAYVSNEEGNPVSGAEVRLEYQVDLDGKVVTVNTDQYGRAFVGALPVNNLQKISVSHPVFAPFTTDKPVSLPVERFAVQLKKRGSVIVKVSGEHPIPGTPAEIFLLHSAGKAGASVPSQGYQESGRVGVVAGQAVFANLPPGWYKAAFAESGAYVETDGIYLEAGSGDHELELTLPKGNHLTGVVKDKKTGQGIPGANVTLKPAVDSSFVKERALQNTTTGEGGAFELYNVGAGTLQAKVMAVGYPDYEHEISFSPGDTVEIELSNSPGGISGHVTVGNSPVDGALVILTKAGPEAAPVASAVTDANGQYKLDGFPVGSYSLSLEAPIGEGDNISRKTVAVQIEDEHATRDINFQNLVAVSGTMRLNGKVIKRAADQPITLLFQSTEPGGESRMVQVDPEGVFSSQLEPGNYSVSLEDRPGIPVEIKTGEKQVLDLKF